MVRQACRREPSRKLRASAGIALADVLRAQARLAVLPASLPPSWLTAGGVDSPALLHFAMHSTAQPLAAGEAQFCLKQSGLVYELRESAKYARQAGAFTQLLVAFYIQPACRLAS